MQITEEMVIEFNQKLKDSECSFKLDHEKIGETGNYKCIIVPANTLYIKDASIGLTKEFYEMMENFFKSKGVNELSYNNTGSIFWSTDGWMDCTECIYGQYYDTCNADWKNDEYQIMLRRHECPYYKEGHRMFEEMVNQH